MTLLQHVHAQLCVRRFWLTRSSNIDIHSSCNSSRNLDDCQNIKAEQGRRMQQTDGRILIRTSPGKMATRHGFWPIVHAFTYVVLLLSSLEGVVAVVTPEPVSVHGILRPHVHFSPPRNYMNDPNGLFYHNGVYNLYYQCKSGESVS